MDILDKIQNEIKNSYYLQNYPNDGQRFVAWYLRNIHLLDQLQTKDAITDGPNDKQIDAVYIDDDEQKIYIIQGKYYLGENIGAEPVREVISSWTQIKDLNLLQEGSNNKLKIKLNEVSKALEDEYSICFELITSSDFTDDARKDIIAFQSFLSSDDSSIFDSELIVIDKQGLDDKYTQAMEKDNPSLNHTINLENGKSIFMEIGSTNVCLTALPLKECIKFPGISNGTLFQKNVRQSLGISNAVNKKIRKTIMGDKCSDFFFFHNGITAICNKMELIDNNQLKVHGISVVNGCQSLNTILSCSEMVKKKDDAYVLFRFYEIPQKDRADSISINTNTQSAVKTRDLRSNDKRVMRLKKAYEQKYMNGYFAAKRGEQLPADKDRNYYIELSFLGKFLIAWYSQRPNLSYGETKIFDKYFDTLFRRDYLAEDLFALNFWYRKIMDIWTENNPLSINETILTMKAYAPYHFLFTISSIVAKLNGKDLVPSPNQCLAAAQKSNLVDSLVGIAANCMNNAYTTGEENAKLREKIFIPQNWIKSKDSVAAIQSAVNNYISFLPTMNTQMNVTLKEAFKIAPEYFEYRLAAD